MIVIIDYGMGNVGSILNMLRKIQVPAAISRRSDDIYRADKLILPGVGAFDEGMANLRHFGLTSVLCEVVQQKETPILGICLGMQLMTRGSAEGKTEGLGWLRASTVRFEDDITGRLKVPHMGWNTLTARKNSPLIRDLAEDWRFYFVHSYHVVSDCPGDVLTVTSHGQEFVSALEHGNISCVQFHPEKSHKYGMRLLGNFAKAGRA